MTGTPLDPGAIRRFVLVLVGVTLVFTLSNLAYVSHEPNTPDVTLQQQKEASRQAVVDVRTATRAFVWHQLDLDRESNVSTWLSTVQLALVAFLALLLAHLRGKKGWLWIGLGFLYLSMDELAQLHEWVGEIMWHSPLKLGFVSPPYPWVLVFGPPFALFGIWMVRFVTRELKQWPDLRPWVFLGLGLLAMTIPLEIVGGKLEGISARLLRVESTMEETCELLGEIVLIFTMLSCAVRTITSRALERRET